MAERHIHLVLDDIDPRALSADDLPILPTRLPCATCGEPRSAHGPWSACPVFERSGAAHRATPTWTTWRSARPSASSMPDEPPAGTCSPSGVQPGASRRVSSGSTPTAQTCGATAYVLHEATIVRVEE